MLLVIIALAGIALEKQNLNLRRAVSHQKFRQEVLLDEHAQHRLKAQQLGAPGKLLDDMPKIQVIEAIPESRTNGGRFVRPRRTLPSAILDDDTATH